MSRTGSRSKRQMCFRVPPDIYNAYIKTDEELLRFTKIARTLLIDYIIAENKKDTNNENL